MQGIASAEDDDADAFPRPFGQYLLLQNFARGGMGEVYLAKIGGIAGLERYCVLKKLRSELTRDREYVTRFIDEARVVVTLSHANICHVFDVGRVGEEYYLAMEYISGRDVRTLQDRCRTRERAVAPASALQVVCETLDALDYAHRRNHPLTGEPLKLVHRDVSPQNVLVSYEGEVKLIDFGLAASKLKVERTQPNVVMGKMAYMAPEQARGDPIDARADLFACGVLLYELIAGERFYEGMTANDIWQVAGKGGFIPRKWDAIDRDLAKHMARALHPDPKKRFASCGDFREALASHLHWRFPGTGVRGLQDMMKDVFDDELRREREMLAKFGKVTVAGFRTEFEETKSQSITLARADETSPTVIKEHPTQLVRNEQSSSTPMGQMPPPQNARDVHQDPTRLVSSSGKALKDPTQVDAAPKPKDTTDEASEVKPREMTMRVARARPPIDLGEDPTSRSASLQSSRSTSRVPLLAAGAVAVVAIVAVAFVMLDGKEPPAPAPPPRPIEIAHTPPPTPRAPPTPLRVEAPAPPLTALTEPPDPPIEVPAHDPPTHDPPAPHEARKGNRGKHTEKIEKQPEKSPEKAPEKAPEKTPEKTPEKAPEKAPEKGATPEKAPPPRTRDQLVEAARRCEICPALANLAAQATTEKSSVVDGLRQCVEQAKCR